MRTPSKKIQPRVSGRGLILAAAMVAQLGLVVACSEKAPLGPSEYAQAERQLSEGNFNSAISLMSERLKVNPDDQKARLILASAYAGRAGLLMRQYRDIIAQITERIQLTEQFLGSRSMRVFDRLGHAGSNPSYRNFVYGFEGAFKGVLYLEQIILIFDFLPTLTGQRREDLKEAIRILADEPDYLGGPALYRGLLRLVDFKNDLADPNHYDFSYVNRCRIRPDRLAEQIAKLRVVVRDIFLDFVLGSRSNPQHPELVEGVRRIDQSFLDAEYYLKLAGTVGDIDNSQMMRELGGQCTR